MTDPMTELWCYVEGKCSIFSVSISPGSNIDSLKKQIYNQLPNTFARYDYLDLILTKVRYI